MSKRKKTGIRNAAPSGLGDRIIAGLTDVRDVLRDGVPVERRFTVRTIDVPEPEPFDAARVHALRQRLGVSQSLFARLLGVSTVLVQSWEQRVRTPSPLARRLLTEVERDPRRWQRMIMTIPGPGARRRRKSA